MCPCFDVPILLTIVSSWAAAAATTFSPDALTAVVVLVVCIVEHGDCLCIYEQDVFVAIA